MAVYPFGDEFIDILSKVVRAWLQKDKVISRLFIIVGIAGSLAGLIGILGQTGVINKDIWEPVAIGIASIAIITVLIIRSYQSIQEQNEIKREIEKVESEAKTNPNKPTATWDLARIKLESYLNRNISQVRWIFFWTIFVMIAGFVIIGYGIMKVYANPLNMNPSILVTIVGLVTELIGATFLIIYKSTMNQAKDYVNVLERINAVGMSVQILESIDDDSKQLQNETRAEIAKELLKLYGTK